MTTIRHSPRLQARSIRKRREIAEAALRVFCANGYALATMDDVCARAGCSKGGLYHHFRAKEEVLEAVIDLMRDEGPIVATLDEHAGTWGVPKAQLARLLVEACAEATRSPALAALMSGTLQMESLADLRELGAMIESVALTEHGEEIAERAA